jgi:hypothetical protein
MGSKSFPITAATSPAPGGELAGKAAIAAREFEKITQNARTFVEIVKKARA